MDDRKKKSTLQFASRTGLVVLCALVAIATYMILRSSARPGDEPQNRGEAEQTQQANAPDKNATPKASDPNPQTTGSGVSAPLQITMPASVMDQYRTISSHEDPALEVWHDISFGAAGNDPHPARLQARGKSSARFARKSFHIDMHKKRTIWSGTKIKRLYLLNLGFDPHGYEMRFGYDCLNALDLFPSPYRLVRVSVNDRDQGLYLAVERPRNGIRRKHDDAVSVFRMKKGGYELRWAAKSQKYPRRILRRLQAAIDTEDADARAQSVSRYLNVDAFVKWMACCSVLMNSDSTGEIFLYERRREGEDVGQFHVMGWDFDDLGKRPSRPENIIDHPLTWACETQLEECILTTPKLSERLSTALKSILANECSPDNIHRNLAKIAHRLSQLDAESQTKRLASIADFESKLLERHDQLSKALAK